MQLSPIQCFQKRCLRLKIVDFENTPITDLVHPDSGEEVGNLLIKAYDAGGMLLGEHVYAKGKPILNLCHVGRGWMYLEFNPLPRTKPKGYPDDEDWDQLTLAADVIAHKALKASSGNGVRPNRQTLPKQHHAGWTYHRVAHGTLNLPRRLEYIDDRLEETRPKQRCALRFMLTENERRCPSCHNLQTGYLLELAPLFCWIPALVTSKLGAADDWDSITANNLGVFSALAYAEPDTRNKGARPEDNTKAPYDKTILHTLDNLRTQRARPYQVGGEWVDMVLHEMPYDWNYHDMRFFRIANKSKNPTDTQAFMATNRNTIIISVRGTEGPFSQDLVQDVKISMKSCPEPLAQIGSAHTGFLQAFEYLWELIRNYCNKHSKAPDGTLKRIFVTGHSLGGAVAALLACAISSDFSNPVTLYTYAAPRIGDTVFARHWNFQVPHMRHVYRNDIIPAAPPAFLGYRHFGHLRQMSLVKAKGTVLPWIGDYGLHQIESAITRQRRYTGDNAPWGPAEMTGYEATEKGFFEFFERKLRGGFRHVNSAVDLAGIMFHFMASNYITFLQNELRQRYEYASRGGAMLSQHIAPRHLDPEDDYDQELLAYMQPVSMAELLDRHVSELVSRSAVEEEVKRFCRDTGRLADMARQEYLLARKESRTRASCHLGPELDPLSQMEMRDGRPLGAHLPTYNSERKALTEKVGEALLRHTPLSPNEIRPIM
ncbi:MAG TPA: hypothetical protein DGF30_00555 [Desulfomicrobium sp.]|nr:hypothetical protein [Desulfomicrobium sp.]